MDQEETKLRLLNAAGEVFSRKGFRSGTIREICACAGANVASVNYHFGGKKELYKALLEHCFQEGMRRHPPLTDVTEGAQDEEALAAFIRSFLQRTLGDGRPSWHSRLMAKEIAEPTPALADMVLSSIKPNMDRLMVIMRSLLGNDASEEHVRLCALSVVGQCQHYSRARSIIKTLFPDLKCDSSGIDVLAEHILRFSLNAILSYRQEGNSDAH